MANKVPSSIVTVAALGALSGLSSIATSIFTLLERNSLAYQIKTDYTRTELTSIAVMVLIVGVIQLLLANALYNGSKGVRLLYSIFAAGNLAFGIWGAIVLSGSQLATSVMGATFGGLVLFVLHTSKADAYFDKK